MPTPYLAYLFLYCFKFSRIHRDPLIFSEPCKIALDKDLTSISAFLRDIRRPALEGDA